MRRNIARDGGPDGRGVPGRRAVKRGQHAVQAELFGGSVDQVAETPARGGAGGVACDERGASAARATAERKPVGQAVLRIPQDEEWREAARNRLAKHSEKAPDSDCLLWTGASRSGYGSLSIRGQSFFAHRVAWALANGDLDPLLQVDHVCFNRSCINPAHLEAVEMRENIRRAWVKARMRTGVVRFGVLRSEEAGFASAPAQATDRQREILRVIADFMAQHGWAPSTRELCGLTGIRSTNGVQDQLKALHRRGLITRGKGARTLALTDAGQRALAC